MITKIRNSFKVYTLMLAVFGMIIGWGISVVTQSVYLAEGTFKVGTVGVPVDENYRPDCKLGRRFIEEPVDVSAILNARYQVADAKRGLAELPYLYEVMQNLNNDLEKTGVFHLSVRGETREQAVEKLQIILDWIVTRHNRLQDSVLADLRVQRDIVTQWLHDRNQVTSTLELNNSACIGKESASTIENIKYRLEVALSSVNNTPTEIILNPVARNNRLKPNTILYMFGTALVIVCLFFVLMGFVEALTTSRNDQD